MGVSVARRPNAPEDENTRLKRRMADALLDHKWKRAVTPAAKRKAFACLKVAFGMSERRT